MEKKLKRQRFVIIILIIAVVYGYFYVSEMKNDLNNRYNSLSNQYNNLNGQINSIYSNVDVKLKEQASLITDFDFSYGKLDKDTLKASVKAKITPKEASPDTKLYLDFGGRIIEMKKGKGMEYTADFETELFLKTDDGTVDLLIKEGSVTKTEDLEWYVDSLHSNFLPHLYSSLIFADAVVTEKKELKIEGDLMFDVLSEEELSSFKNKKLYFLVNDIIISEEDILQSSGFSDRTEIIKIYPDVKAGDKVSLYVEAEDEYGFIHRNIVKEVICGGEPVTVTIEENERPSGDIILDKEGNVLSDGWK